LARLAARTCQPGLSCLKGLARLPARTCQPGLSCLKGLARLPRISCPDWEAFLLFSPCLRGITRPGREACRRGAASLLGPNRLGGDPVAAVRYTAYGRPGPPCRKGTPRRSISQGPSDNGLAPRSASHADADGPAARRRSHAGEGGHASRRKSHAGADPRPLREEGRTAPRPAIPAG
jgi:hypothetical protein